MQATQQHPTTGVYSSEYLTHSFAREIEPIDALCDAIRQKAPSVKYDNVILK